ncbi:GH25 family lysozyme, partial [Microbispora corallina]
MTIRHSLSRKSAIAPIIRLGTAVVTAAMAIIAIAAAPAAAIPVGYSINGVDVYEGNGSIDWAAASAAGIRFGWAKATEGLSHVDGRYATNYTNAKNNGVYLGAYAFGRPDLGVGTGRAQADFLLDHAQYVADGKTLPPQLDIEWPYENSSGNYVAPYPCYGLSPSQMVTWIRDFVTEVKNRTGRDAAIYTNYNWWKDCTGNNGSFGANPLEIAHYVDPDSGSSYGSVPAGWSRPTAWQYNCSRSVPGTSSNNKVCQTAFIGGYAELTEFAGASNAVDRQGPSSVVDASGAVQVFARGSDGSLKHWYWSNGWQFDVPGGDIAGS